MTSATAFQIDARTELSRPSLKLGTHSTVSASGGTVTMLVTIVNSSEAAPQDAASLLDLSVRDFLSLLASAAPAPGGGAGAALLGAIGAALVQMAANLTVGRPKYAVVEEEARQIRADAEALRARLEHLLDEDAQAFAKVSAAYRLPRSTDAEQGLRSEAVQVALREAARAPLEIARASRDVLSLGVAAAPVLNGRVISDVLVAGIAAEAGLEAGGVNVDINLGSLSDVAFARGLAGELQAIRQQGDALLAGVEEGIRARMPDVPGAV